MVGDGVYGFNQIKRNMDENLKKNFMGVQSVQLTRVKAMVGTQTQHTNHCNKINTRKKKSICTEADDKQVMDGL